MANGRTTIPNRVIDAMLDRVASVGWREVGLRDIADGAGIKLDTLHARFSGKYDILAQYIDQVDGMVLRETPAGGDSESARDRLFDVLMRRFDLLNKHKPAIVALVHDLRRDPVAGLWVACRLQKSMKWMLEAAALKSHGIRGRLRRRGLFLIYLRTQQVWLRDDSEDMARTMAELDRQLKRAESMVRSLPGRRRRDPPPEGTQAAVSPGH